MPTQLIILLATAMILVIVCKRGPARAKPHWSQHLKGSQKALGPVAFVGVLLIMINPEFLALGLLGDAAFFDMLVLALTLQMHQLAVQAWRRCVAFVTGGARWLGIPSPGLCYVLTLSASFVGGAASSLQEAFRFSSWS